MSLLRKGLLASGGHVFCLALSMCVGILFSRQLGPAGMGQYELLRSAALTVGALAAFGLGNANIYFLNNRGVPPEAIVSHSVWIVGVLLAALTAGLAAAVLSTPDYFGQLPTPVVILFALGTAAHAGRLILRPILTARLEVPKMVWVELIRQAIMLGGGLLLTLGGWLSTEWAVVLLACGFYGSLTLPLVFLRRFVQLRRRFDWALFGKVFVYGLKLGAATVLFGLTQHLSVFLLRALRPDQFEEVGLYSRAVAICGLIMIVPFAIGPLLYARWATISGEQRTRQVELAARMSTTYGLSCAVFVAVCGKYLIWLLYGAQFMPAQEALIILAPALVCLTLYNTCNQLLAGAGQAAITAGILAGSTVVVCVSTWLLVPTLGIRGAALGVLCGNGFTTLVTVLVCRHLYGLDPRACWVMKKRDLRYVWQALWQPPAS